MATAEPELSLVPRGDMVKVLRKQTYYPGLRRWVDVAGFGLIAVQLVALFTTFKGGIAFAAYGLLASLNPIVGIAVLRLVALALVDIADGVAELRLKARRAPAPPV